MALTHLSSTNSVIDVYLGNVPTNVEDPELLYRELLNIHTAIEAILTALADVGADSVYSYILKQRSVTATDITNYTVLETDGLILLSGLSNSCTAVLPTAANVKGHRFTIKCVDDTNPCYVLPAGAEEIDAASGNFQLWKHEVIEIQSDGAAWWIR